MSCTDKDPPGRQAGLSNRFGRGWSSLRIKKMDCKVGVLGLFSTTDTPQQLKVERSEVPASIAPELGIP